MIRLRETVRSALGGTLALALVVGGLTSVWATQSSAQARVIMPKICQSHLGVSKSFGVNIAGLNRGTLVLDGRTVTLTDDSASWQVYDAIDYTFNNRFHGLQWLVPWAAVGGDAVSLIVRRDAALPDPGVQATPDVRRSTGWTIGAFRIRQHVVNCLYELTRDERLIPVIEGIVAANLEPARYRGRPIWPVHNHGMLANHALIESARVFDRPEWSDIAFARMQADAETVFAPCGMSVEQSSSYQLTNLNIWNRGLRLAGPRLVTDSPGAEGMVDRARLAVVQLSRPDGILEAIGNANQRDVASIVANRAKDDTESTDTRLWCPKRGWAANRTSWDDTAIHYTLRFGPRPQLHGHADHGSLTWFAHGVPVLSDPGLFDKTRNERRRSAESLSAHSVLEPVGRSLNKGTRAVIEDSPAGVDQYTLVTRHGKVIRTRHVEVNLNEAVLRVRDEAQSRWPIQWLQHWQLDPKWTPVSGVTAWTPIARHPRGLFLYAVCHSGIPMRMSVSTREHHHKWRTSQQAMSLRCGGMDRNVKFDTLLVVSPINGTLTWDRVSGAYGVSAPAEESR